MAWPVTNRFLDFIANVTVITHDFLNSIQDVVTNFYGGKRTVVSLSVDGVGDQASNASPGDVVASNDVVAGNDVVANGGVSAFTDVTARANLNATNGHARVGELKTGTALPTPACQLGELYADLIPIGWARCVVAGNAISLAAGVNVKALAYNGVGSYTVTFGTAPTLPGFHGVAFVTSYSSPDVTFWCQTGADGNGNMTVDVHARSVAAAPAAADGAFFIIAFSG